MDCFLRARTALSLAHELHLLRRTKTISTGLLRADPGSTCLKVCDERGRGFELGVDLSVTVDLGAAADLSAVLACGR